MTKSLGLAQKLLIKAARVFVVSAMVVCKHIEASDLAAIESIGRETPQDLEATAYVASCETDFKRLAAELASFADYKPATDLALLNKLNGMDLILDLQLSRAGLYSNVHPNKEVRSAAEVCEQRFVEVSTDIGLSRSIYDQLKRVDAAKLSLTDKRYFEHLLRD